MTSYLKEGMNVTAIEQSYIFSHGIAAITTMSTKFGVTSKGIVSMFIHLHYILKYISDLGA
jgi:ER membrane protein complex subunit 1